MPAGVSWFRYISLSTAAMISAMAGAQCVHMIYNPLDDLDDLVELKLRERLSQQENKSSKNVES